VDPELVSDAVSANHFGPLLAMVAITLATAPFLYQIPLALFRLLANLRLGRAASLSYDPEAALRPGHTVVGGVAELLPTESRAVRVEIEQHGTERRSRNGTNHTWTEVGREVDARPFLLRLPSGAAIRVEPDPEVQLVDTLDHVVRLGTHERKLIGELTAGETTFAVGELVHGDPLPGKEHGYREAPQRELMLRAPSHGRLLLATQRLGSRYYARTRFHLRWLGLGLASLAFSHLIVFGTYWRSWREGRNVVAEVTRLHRYVTGSGKSRTTHHDVHLKRTDGREPSQLRIDASGGSFDRLAVGTRVVLREVVGGSPLTRGIFFGKNPSLNAFGGGVALALAIGILAGFVARRRSTRPWYDRATYNVSGKGPLWSGG